jgi:hypothetical protein
VAAAEDREESGRWSRRAIIELRLCPDQGCEINNLPTGRLLARDRQQFSGGSEGRTDYVRNGNTAERPISQCGKKELVSIS